jgi:SAM-dependent methyltransferase
MSAESPSFILPNSQGSFSVDPMAVAPESIFATGRLLTEILRHRALARGRMLDIGCGTKPYATVFGGLVDRHIGVDVPFTMHGVKAIDAFAPSHRLPFRDSSFDFVLCTEVLEHVPDPGEAWREIGRVLRPGGVTIVTTPFIYRFHEMPHDYWRITPPAHRMMARRAGLEVDSIQTRGGFLTVLADIKLKGLIYFVRGVRKLLRRPARPGRITRLVFAAIQWPLTALLGRENIKADEFTLGLVVVARKPLIQ